jgi:hypothetical protein
MSTMSAGDDMYKAILKEIGAEESHMGYLFDESDDEDVHADDYEGDENKLIGDNTRGGIVMQHVNGQTFMSDDDQLLHQWESEVEDDVVDDPNKIERDVDDVKSFSENSVYRNGSIHSRSDNTPSEQQQQQQPGLKLIQMLEVANAKQGQLMGQMINLQRAQKESSPRNKIKRLTIGSEKAPNEEGDEISASSPVVLKEISHNDPNLNSSTFSSSTMQQISTRNVKLQDQWQSQQEKSAKLQDKLTVMQTQFYNQQDQWEKEQEELFSPTRSPTKIPRWRSSALTTNNSTVNETPALNENKTDWISAKNSNTSLDNTSSQESETSKALILQLKAQLEESRKFQESQKEELSDCKDRLKKRDVEHQAFLLQYETEKKSWKDEIKEKQARHHQELKSRDADLEDTRQKLHQQITANQDLREIHQDELKQLISGTDALKVELETTQNQMKSEMEENQKQSAYIHGLEDENHRLKHDFTRKEDLDSTQNEIKSQMIVAIEEQTKKKREFQSRIRELEGRHDEELEYWKTEVDDHRRQIELNSTRMETQLEDANVRFAELERKHDKEVKEWQHLLDADITKAVADTSGFEDHHNMLEENKKNLMVIGAGSTSTGLLSPIRKASSMRPRQSYNEGRDNSYMSSGGDNSSNEDPKNMPSESMNMIDGLLQELGEMDMERTAILKEINDNDDDDGPVQIGHESEDYVTEVGSKEEPPKPLESPDNSWDPAEMKNVNVSDATNESEVLDQTLHLLNNLKTMLTSHGKENENETTVLERLEVLSELMQSQDQSNTEFTPAKPSVSETHSGHNGSSSSAVDEMSFAISASQGNANDASYISTVKPIATTDPWPALVAELKNRCEFLERDRDEVTRITEQILEMERDSHKVELEAAVATAERKASETLHRIQLESNREMSDFYQNVCFQCEQEAFDYSNGREEIDE